MVAGSTASAKAKARLHQQFVATEIQDAFDLPEEDVVSVPMGSPGLDILLSARAREEFPYGVECKRVEKLSIPAWWAQCRTNAEKEGLRPLLVYRRSREGPMVVMRWFDFIEIAAKAREWDAELDAEVAKVIDAI
jgi:hypothetical protein